jgi:hypothetical protein
MPATATARRSMKPAPRPRLYTTDEVAALTGRAAVTIKLRSLRFQAQGKEFGQKVGRQWLYTEDEIRELAAIPAQRGRTPKGTIEKRRRELANVPLDQLAAHAQEPDDGPDPEPAS